MTYLADAHREWYTVHGAYAICPLDCGAMSPEQAEAEELCNVIAYADEHGTASIRCAHCPDRHGSADAVRACAALADLGKARDAREAAEAAAEAERAEAERKRADSQWSWDYQNRWGRAENE